MVRHTEERNTYTGILNNDRNIILLGELETSSGVRRLANINLWKRISKILHVDKGNKQTYKIRGDAGLTANTGRRKCRGIEGICIVL